MDYKLHTMPSGLRVVTVPMPSLESVTLTIWVKTGSRNEETKVGGISHFLEHMVFKGSKKYPTMKELFEIFDTMGAEHNASTAKEWTNFYVKLPVFDLERGFDILSDVVLNPLLDPKEAKKEKSVIFEEMKMIEDVPMRHIGDVFEELVYNGNPLGRDIIGTRESMNSITRNDFINYRKKNYYPKNMLITVAGGVKEVEVIRLVNKYFGNFYNSQGSTFKIQTFEDRQANPCVKIKTKETDQAHFILGFLTEGRGYKNRYAQTVLASLLGSGASSRLFTEVREKRGLAYAVGGSLDRYSDVGCFDVYVGSDTAKSYEAISVILDQCYGIAQNEYKVSQKELDKVKGFIKGRTALSLEDSENVNDFFAEQILFDKEIFTPEEVFKKIDKITIDDVNVEAKKLFIPSHLNLAVIGPFKDKGKFVKLLK